MTWIRDTVAEFGRQIGVEGLTLNERGGVQLTFASGGFLAVETATRGDQEEILVYMGRPVGFQAVPLLRSALNRAHFSAGDPWAVQVALRGTGPDTLVLALVRLQGRTFTPQALAQSVDFLARWLDEVQGARER